MQKVIQLFFILFITIFANSQTLSIAVKELKGEGVTIIQKRLFSQTFRSELVNRHLFTVMEREEMASIMEEQKFQMSGACSDSSCLVELGEILGVQYIIDGTIGKVSDNYYTAIVKVINVETGKIHKSVSKSFRGDINSFITRFPKELAIKLTSEILGDKISLNIRKKGDLHISSQYRGASVIINGDTLKGKKTPVTLTNIPSGQYEIIVKKDNYYGKGRAFVLPKKLTKINISMRHGTGNFRVFSEPTEAKIYLDNKFIGKTPYNFRDISVGKHKLKLTQKGYAPLKKIINLEFNKDLRKKFKLKPLGKISVMSNNYNAEIFINNKKVGISNIKDRVILAEQPMNIMVTADGYDTSTQIINLQKGEHKKLRMPISWRFGELNITTIPDGVTLYVNGLEKGVTGYSDSRLLPGIYKITLKQDSLNSYSEDIQIFKDKTTSRQILLTNGKWSKGGEISFWKRATQISLGLLSIGSAAASYYQYKTGNEDSKVMYNSIFIGSLISFGISLKF